MSNKIFGFGMLLDVLQIPVYMNSLQRTPIGYPVPQKPGELGD